MPSAHSNPLSNLPSPEQLLAESVVASVHFADELSRQRVAPLLNGAAGQAAWTLVKRNASRSVYRRPDAQGSLYFKHYHGLSPSHRFQRLLGRYDSRCEMQFTRRLADGHVPVPRALAACWANGSEWLITQGVEPTAQADTWHAQQLAQGNWRAIRQASLSLAELVGRMHQAGVIHPDLHCGNVLVRTDDPSQVVLIDLHRMSHHRRLGLRRRAANLAILLSDRLLWTSRSERLRFLRRYLQTTGQAGDLRLWIHRIWPIAHRISQAEYRRCDRRIFGRNSYFTRFRVGGYRAHAMLTTRCHVPASRCFGHRFTPQQWKEALADPAALFSGPGVEVIKDSPSSLVVRRKLQVGPLELDVYVKRARRKKPIRLMLDLFRRSRAMRAFGLGHMLLNRQLLTAVPLAAMERRQGRFLTDSILITEAASSAMELHKFLGRYLGLDEPLELTHRRSLARQGLWQLGRMVRRLQQERFTHRDLKANNVLVDWDGQVGHAPQLVLVDLDGLGRVGHVSRKQQFRGLMRLNVSLLECPVVNKAGRLRMLLGYLRSPEQGPVNFKAYWRVLELWSDKKIRRQIRSRQRRQRQVRRTQAWRPACRLLSES